jgi:hypothetical protein
MNEFPKNGDDKKDDKKGEEKPDKFRYIFRDGSIGTYATEDELIAARKEERENRD